MLASVLRPAIRPGILIFLAASACLVCHSQTDSQVDGLGPAGFAAATLQKEVQEVRLLLSVTDHRSRFIENLTPAEITIKDNGEAPEKITYFEAQTGLPLQVAILIDSSDSILSWFEAEKRAADTFLKHALREASDVALIIAFNNQVRIAKGPTGDHSQLSRAIQDLHPGGETAIYDAVAFASQQLEKIQDLRPARRALIVITDGEDNSSHMRLETASSIAQETESIIYILDVREEYVGDPRAEAAMNNLAEVTGGRCWRVDTEGRIKKAFDQIESELRSQYAIAYKPANVKPDGSFHQISVIVPRKLRARHRQGYFAR